MKIAATSATFERLFASDRATHLEWLEWCAENTDLDGVVMRAADFPRRDGEYVAQVKKIATDVGLAIAAVADDGLFDAGAGDEQIAATLDLAVALGAPYVMCATGPRGEIPPESFSATVAVAGRAAGAAKRRNVTLAVRAIPGTVTPDLETLLYFAKHVDSAWLRLIAQPLIEGTLSAGPRSRTVLAYASIPDPNAARLLAERLHTYRGWVVVEAGGEDPREALKTTTRDLRRALAETFLTPTA